MGQSKSLCQEWRLGQKGCSPALLDRPGNLAASRGVAGPDARQRGHDGIRGRVATPDHDRRPRQAARLVVGCQVAPLGGGEAAQVRHDGASVHELVPGVVVGHFCRQAGALVDSGRVVDYCSFVRPLLLLPSGGHGDGRAVTYSWRSSPPGMPPGVATAIQLVKARACAPVVPTAGLFPALRHGISNGLAAVLAEDGRAGPVVLAQRVGVVAVGLPGHDADLPAVGHVLLERGRVEGDLRAGEVLALRLLPAVPRLAVVDGDVGLDVDLPGPTVDELRGPSVGDLLGPYSAGEIRARERIDARGVGLLVQETAKLGEVDSAWSNCPSTVPPLRHRGVGKDGLQAKSHQTLEKEICNLHLCGCELLSVECFESDGVCAQ
ncbi:hypothetical protein PG990_010757 [Apiospora arundinis]